MPWNPSSGAGSSPAKAMSSSSIASARRTKPLEWWATRSLLRILYVIGRVTPRRALSTLGGLLGAAAYRGMKRYRETALSNLERAYGDTWSEAERVRVAKESLRHL